MDSALTTVVLPLALGIIMFGLGLTLTPGDFGRVARAPKAVAIALACQLILLPLVCFGLVVLFDLSPALGIGMMLADRPSRSDRRLARRGLEGWARIEHMRPLGHTVDNGELTELDLSLTVPGSDSYSGTVIYEVQQEDIDRFVVGETVSVRVDPRNRDRIMLCP